MKSKTKSTVAVCVFVAVTVLFFITIICLAMFLPDDGEQVPADYGMRYNSMDVAIVWNSDRSCSVTHSIEAEFLDNGSGGNGSHGLYIDIPVNSGEKVRNLKVTSSSKYGALPCGLEHESMFRIVRVVIGDDDLRFMRGDKISCTLEYDYITPEHPDGKDILDINAIGRGFASPIRSATVTVKFPVKPNGGGVTAYIGDARTAFNVSGDGLTYTVTATEIAPFIGVRVKAEMPRGALQDYNSTEPVLPIVLGIVLVAAAVLMMIFLGREKPLTPVVDYYPPRITGKNGKVRHMLPVQMGTLIDGTCSNTDVTSLIFYWASKGYLSIEQEKEEDETYFIKIKDVDPVTDYEKRMFDKLFENGKGDKENGGNIKVSLSSLKGKFATTITNTRVAVSRECGRKLYKPTNNLLFGVIVALCMLYGVGFAVLTTLRIGSMFFNFIGLLVILPVIVAAAFGTFIARNYIKFSAKRRYLLLAALFIGTVLLSVAVALSIPTDAMSWSEKLVFAACLGVASAISPFITQRTPEYNEKLNHIIGFRDFLRDAEKERLETLLAEDPQYYYDILPYANVLGVSDIWSEKFAGLAVEPPTYYHGSDINVFDVIVLNSLLRSVGNTLTYTPPRVNGGSFSGKGFGGGGGGSFGGFGGGGGGRW